LTEEELSDRSAVASTRAGRQQARRVAARQHFVESAPAHR
jgi:hypothetical protein